MDWNETYIPHLILFLQFCMFLHAFSEHKRAKISRFSVSFFVVALLIPSSDGMGFGAYLTAFFLTASAIIFIVLVFALIKDMLVLNEV